MPSKQPLTIDFGVTLLDYCDRFFCKETDTFIKDALNWLRGDHKTIYNVTNYFLFQINAIHQRIKKKTTMRESSMNHIFWMEVKVSSRMRHNNLVKGN